ncbi:MAG: hypothetical protein GXP26_17605 [Planctomycetes bacterium]|nr:hypothetical protein [Planctomycetota bacterium]
MIDESKSKALQQIAPMIVAAIFAIAALYAIAGNEKTDFDQFALDEYTISFFPEVDSYPIHVKSLDEIQECLAGWAHRGRKPVVLWLGNSQLHAVNQAGPHGEPSSAKLHRRLQEIDLDLLTFSLPNANLQEHYLLFEYLRGMMNIRTVLLPVVFDDMRETGIRSEISLAIREPRVRKELETTALGRQIIQMNADAAKPDADDPSLGGVRNTLQEVTEAALNNWLDEHSTLWTMRKDLRGQFFTSLYKLRNLTLNISSQSERRLIPGRYSVNKEAMEALLESASNHQMQVLTYVVPLRNDVKVPYDAKEYEKFKQEVSEIAVNNNADFRDFESLVPGELWGQKASIRGKEGGYDFMHFQEGGHELLARAMEQYLSGKQEKHKENQ